MKIKNIFIVCCAVYILCLPAIASEPVYAWLNGTKSGQDENVYAVDPVTLGNDFEKTHTHLNPKPTASYYATHDWIAECALDIVYSNYPQHKFIEMLYMNINLMKYYYLLGTEAPDFVTYNSKDFRVDTGQHVLTFVPRLRYHSVRFDAEGTINPRSFLANGATICQNEALKYLMDKDCRAAAFYLGCIAHFIGDAVLHTHLVDEDYDVYSSEDRNAKHGVRRLTSRKLEDSDYCDGVLKPEDQPFLTHNEAWTEFYVNKPYFADAYQATWYAAYHAYYGKAPFREQQGYPISNAGFKTVSHKNASWLIQQGFPSELFDITLPERRQSYWNQISGDEKDYMEAVQHNLNVAIYYTAAVINSVKDSYVECHAFDESEFLRQMAQHAGSHAFIVLFSIVGNLAALLVITAQKAGDKVSGIIGQTGLNPGKAIA